MTTGRINQVSRYRISRRIAQKKLKQPNQATQADIFFNIKHCRQTKLPSQHTTILRPVSFKRLQQTSNWHTENEVHQETITASHLQIEPSQCQALVAGSCNCCATVTLFQKLPSHHHHTVGTSKERSIAQAAPATQHTLH